MSFRGLAKKTFFGSLLAGTMIFGFTACAAIATWLYLKSEVAGKVVVVPDLFSKTEAEAMAFCRDRGLLLRVNNQDVHSPVVARDLVLLQVPRAGRKIKEGRTVEITRSAGPQKKLVPDLLGQTLTFSNTLLDESGLSARVVSRMPSDLYPRGHVLAQAPTPGEELGIRKGVSLLVSDGPQVPWFVTPNLVGKDYQAARTFLDQVEIRVITRYRAGDEDLGQMVLEQSPKAGYPINKTQTMTLVVNKDF